MENKIVHHTNIKMIPLDIVRGIKDTWNHTKGDADYSVTELLQPPKVRALKILHKEEISEDYSDSIAAFIGTAVHQTIENANKIHDDCKTEERMEVSLKIDGKSFLISGTVDHYSITDNILSDYKTTNAYAVNYDKPDWTHQLNIYRWMYSKLYKDNPIPDARIIAILKDWSKGRATNSNTYPPSPVMIKPIENWGQDEIQDFIVERIKLHEEAMKEPQKFICSDEEIWLSPKGIATRCEQWCNVNSFCQQYKEREND